VGLRHQLLLQAVFAAVEVATALGASLGERVAQLEAMQDAVKINATEGKQVAKAVVKALRQAVAMLDATVDAQVDAAVGRKLQTLADQINQLRDVIQHIEEATTLANRTVVAAHPVCVSAPLQLPTTWFHTDALRCRTFVFFLCFRFLFFFGFC
jgi:hypothetical protein